MENYNTNTGNDDLRNAELPDMFSLDQANAQDDRKGRTEEPAGAAAPKDAQAPQEPVQKKAAESKPVEAAQEKEKISRRKNGLAMFNRARTPYRFALSNIPGGASLTDINPMYRIQKFTEEFGPVGEGWMFTTAQELVDYPCGINQKTRQAVKSGQLLKTDITFRYRTEAGEDGLSEKMTATSLVPALMWVGAGDEKRPVIDADIYKKGVTDAMGQIGKLLGIGAEVYYSRINANTQNIVPSDVKGEKRDRNLRIFKKAGTPPEDCLKSITGPGHMAHMTDINSMWRIEMLSELFGMYGTGWIYTTGQEIMSIFNGLTGKDGTPVFEPFLRTDMEFRYYSEELDDWSYPITVRSLMPLFNTYGRFDDDVYKKGVTSALGQVCKLLGIGANVYYNRVGGGGGDNSSKYAAAGR